MDKAYLGRHGLAGDRRFAVRQIDQRSGSPWLTASKMPELLRYHPCDFCNGNEPLPTHVKTPSGDKRGINCSELWSEIAEQAGCEVEVVTMKEGIFDDSPVSIIASSTISHICQKAKVTTEWRRFRANIVVELDEPIPFLEDNWLGQDIVFGNGETAPSVHITKLDARCKMIGLDPDTAEHTSSLVKTVVELNDNNAGVYGSVVNVGLLNVGDGLYLVDH